MAASRRIPASALAAALLTAATVAASPPTPAATRPRAGTPSPQDWTVTDLRPAGSPAPRPTPSTVPSPTPARRPVARPAARPSVRARPTLRITTGWHSGATGPGSLDGAIGRLRGEPVQVVGVFADTTATVQATLPVLGSLARYDGDVDIALGGLTDDTPESWAKAAKGAYDARWRRAARALRAARAPHRGAVYVRFAHDANATWFPWRVTARETGSFRTAWRRFHDILAQEYPAARLVFSVDATGGSGVPLASLWPGDDVVDVVGVGVRTGSQPIDPARWKLRLDDVARDGSPLGLGAWLAFAARHHKPLAVTRWGLDPGPAAADDGTRVRLMYAFLSGNAASRGRDASGRVLYDVFANYAVPVAGGMDTRLQITDPRNAAAAQVYRSLTWGSA